MRFGPFLKLIGLAGAAVALIVTFAMAGKNSTQARDVTLGYAWLTAGFLMVAAFGEIAVQTRRRADAAMEANRIAERRANLDGARLAQENSPRQPHL